MAKIGGQSNIALPTVFEVSGNSATEKAIGDVAVLQVKKILEAQGEFIDSSEMMMMTAEQISMAEGFEQGQYVFPERMVWGNDYDVNSGAIQQGVAVRRATVMMDQMLTFKYDVPTFDVNRFMESPVGVRATTIGEWMRTMSSNWFQNMNAIYMQGVVDMAIATGQFIVLAPPTDTDTAQSAYYSINDAVLTLVENVNALMFGTKKSEIKIHLSMRSWAQMTKAFVKILEKVAADTLATSNLWREAILGTDVNESWYMGRQFVAGKDTGINKDLSFNLNGTSNISVWGFLGHLEDCAMPQRWKQITQVMNPNTFNIRYGGRGIYSLPTFMRQLTYLLVSKAPTNAEITAAQANYGITFNLAPWIGMQPVTVPDLSTIITVTDLDTWTWAGTNPTVAELETQITAKNSSYVTGDATFSAITATGAVATGTPGKYKGTVNLTYVKG